jgi:hypothetical protein
MRVLIACEFTGTIREAFQSKGHRSYSCDLRPSEIPGNHFQCDVREVINDHWDLIIAHPPCTYLSSAGSWTMHPNHAGKYPGRKELRQSAYDFFMMFTRLKCKRVCIENPAGCMSVLYKPPTQIIEPYYFGQSQRKRTCLWLKGLPRLNGLLEVAMDPKKFEPLPGFISKSGKKRYFIDMQNTEAQRSKSFPAIAEAMAQQWNF